MPDAELPIWLSDLLPAARDDARDPSLQEDEPAEVLPGDICVVRPVAPHLAPARLFVVSDVGTGWCEGMLAGIETELATEVDVVLDTASADLGYEIAVHTRFSGPVWITQLTRRVGAIDEHVLDQLLALAWNDEPDGVDLARGIPLQPAGVDPRYVALERMSAELDQLTADCRSRRAELAAPVLDPAIAQPDVLRAMASEPFSRLVIAGADAPQALVDELLASGS